MPHREEGVSEVVAVLLLVAAGMVLSAVVFTGILGLARSMEQTPYVAFYAEEAPPGGVRLVSLGGDPLVFGGGDGELPLELVVDDASGSHTIDPGGVRASFRPGDALCIWWDGSEYRAGADLPGAGLSPLPPGPLSVRLVDGRHHLLIGHRAIRAGAAAPVTTTACTPLQVDFTVPAVVRKDRATTFTGTVIAGTPVRWTWIIRQNANRVAGPFEGESVRFIFPNNANGWLIELTATDACGRTRTVERSVTVVAH